MTDDDRTSSSSSEEESGSDCEFFKSPPHSPQHMRCEEVESVKKAMKQLQSHANDLCKDFEQLNRALTDVRDISNKGYDVGNAIETLTMEKKKRQFVLKEFLTLIVSWLGEKDKDHKTL